MTTSSRTVLLTGCSDASLGSALALALHNHGGWQVLATARDKTHMSALSSQGIKTFALDVTSAASISALVQDVSALTHSTLDMLVNTVGGGHYQPFLHLDLAQAKALFDVNVWGYVAVTQAFLPLLLARAHPGKAVPKPVIVNNTSISSVLRTPFHAAYSASKAAAAMFSAIQRVELAPLGVCVVDLKTGSLASNFQRNKSNPYELPRESPYQPIREDVLRVVRGEKTEAYAEDRSAWAEDVVRDLLRNPEGPPAQIWRGGMAGTVRVASALEGVLPEGWTDGSFQGLGGLDKLGKMLEEQGKGE